MALLRLVSNCPVHTAAYCGYNDSYELDLGLDLEPGGPIDLLVLAGDELDQARQILLQACFAAGEFPEPVALRGEVRMTGGTFAEAQLFLYGHAIDVWYDNLAAARAPWPKLQVSVAMDPGSYAQMLMVLLDSRSRCIGTPR